MFTARIALTSSAVATFVKVGKLTTSKRPVVQSLRNICIEASENSVRLISTDYTTAAVYVDADARALDVDDGAARSVSVLIPFDFVASAAKMIKKNTKNVTFEIMDNSYGLRAAVYVDAINAGSIVAFYADEAPHIPTVEAMAQAIDDAAAPAEVIDDSAAASIVAAEKYASTELSQDTLNAVAYGHSVTDGAPAWCATDGYRMYISGRALRDGSFKPAAILPRNFVRCMAEIKTGGALKYSEDCASFANGDGLTVYTKSYDAGTYPNVCSVIPQVFERRVAFDRLALIGALERIAPVANTRTRQVTVTLKEDINTGAYGVHVDIVAQNPDTGASADATIEAVNVSDWNPSAGFVQRFNVDYLLRILKDFKSARVVYGSNKNIAATIWVQEIEAANTPRALLMPTIY